jgi:hypothetical protein
VQRIVPVSSPLHLCLYHFGGYKGVCRHTVNRKDLSAQARRKFLVQRLKGTKRFESVLQCLFLAKDIL